jgi:hypothetical protein
MTYSFAAVTIAIVVIITTTAYVQSGASTSSSSIVQDLSAFHSLHVLRPITLEPRHAVVQPAEPLKAADQT